MGWTVKPSFLSGLYTWMFFWLSIYFCLWIIRALLKYSSARSLGFWASSVQVRSRSSGHWTRSANESRYKSLLLTISAIAFLSYLKFCTTNSNFSRKYIPSFVQTWAYSNAVSLIAWFFYTLGNTVLASSRQYSVYAKWLLDRYISASCKQVEHQRFMS